MFDIEIPKSRFSPESILAVSGASGILPRFQVCGGNSEVVKEGKIPVGVFGLVMTKENIVDLGKTADIVLIAYRTKAIHMDKPNNRVLAYYNHESTQFKKIATESFQKDSNKMFGSEFLVWVPSYPINGNGTFATFFFGSPTGRNEAPGYMALMKQGENPDGTGIYKPTAATVKTRFIKNAKFSWHGTETPIPCSKPFDTTWDNEELTKTLELFLNPQDSVVEEAPPETRDR